ncbi:MAG TPA: hypothetical protein PK303_09335 [bacterium]|nr:hypothetical protein [bacterium]HOL35811.1 hypothetical protein [bacterium]HPP09300.1 hypothetical protein [bacterium]
MKLKNWCLLVSAGLLILILFLRVHIGGIECGNGAKYVWQIQILSKFLSLYIKMNNKYPQSFKDFVPEQSMTMLPDIDQFCYLYPEKGKIKKGTVLIYMKKPSWHFHTLSFGQLRIPCVLMNNDEITVSFLEAPRNRYNGKLRKIFFWYFLFYPFTGPEDITPAEVQQLARNKMIK